MASVAAAPVLALVFNAFVWGLSWLPFRALQERGMHPLWSTGLIYVVSLAVLFALRPRAAAGWTRQPLLWLLALSAGMTNVGFNWAVTIGDVVRVVLLFYLMPAWSVLLAWIVLGDRPGRLALVRLVVALAGVVLVLQTPGAAWPWPRSLADVLALAGGFSFALTNVLLLRLKEVPVESRVLAMFGGGATLAVSVALLGLLQGTVPAFPAATVGVAALALLLSASFLLGNLALQYGAARLPAHTTALVMLSEVVFAALSSVALGASELTTGVVAGGGLILAAAAWAAWPARRQGAQ